ncbi:MAG: FtsL-like putative cell division protein [Bacteroidota bacterium]
MGHNTYKSHKKSGLFAYLEDALRFSILAAYGLPARYLTRLLFLFALGILYVGNTHYHERMVRRIHQLEQEVGSLKVDYTTLKASYMFDSKQSEVAKRVAPMGLASPPYPPLKINRK